MTHKDGSRNGWFEAGLICEQVCREHTNTSFLLDYLLYSRKLKSLQLHPQVNSGADDFFR